MGRLDIDRQNTLSPIRMEKAKQEITKLGYTISFENETEIRFNYEGSTICYFPYSGWHTGASIKDGRGLSRLLRQIKK